MKRTITTLAAILFLAASCHQPEWIEPTADRQGLTSITAIFTFGPYVNQEMSRLTVTDDTQERYVIEVPWFFPPTSDDESSPYMTKVRVQAELQPNFKIEPGLGILDLTEENWFTYTNPKGESHRICITGERIKSSECNLLAFSLNEPAVVGIIDQSRHTVTLPTKDDVTSCKASFQVSPHATISPDPAKARDYSQPVVFTVTAHNGETLQYTVATGDPEKIDMGFNSNTVERLFNLDPVSRIGLPDYKSPTAVSLAAIGGHLVICTGDGSVPVAVNRLNGTKVGAIKLGNAVAGSITNDEAEHMLITNVAEGGSNVETVNIYRTNAISETPTLFYSFQNPTDCPIGHKMKVMGDIDGEAVIVFTAEGIAGVTTCAKVVCLTVSEGAVRDVAVTDFASTGLGWGAAPTNTATVVPASLTPGLDGWLLDYYEGGSQTLDMLHYISGSGADTPLWAYGGDNAWGYNANCLDSKTFNHVRYASVLVTSHFPQWGLGPMLYLYDISDPSAPSLCMSNESISWYQQGDASDARGDVVIAPSADGYKLYIYYYDANAQAIGGYVADCIKR